MKISVYQGEAIPLDFAHNLDLLDQAAATAKAGGAHLLVTPELFATGYAPALIAAGVSDEHVAMIESALRATAARHGIALVYSTPGRGDAATRGITATLVDSAGQIVGGYTKSHLFGPAEAEAFRPGRRPPTVVSLNGLRIGLAICYDLEFPEVARAAAVRGAELLVVPTAVGLGAENLSLVLVPARALENSMTVAYSNHGGVEAGFEFSGTSVIADPRGAIVAAAGETPSLIFAEVDAITTEVDYLADRQPDLYSDWSNELAAEEPGGRPREGRT
jgi:predicted amidohydrolase